MRLGGATPDEAPARGRPGSIGPPPPKNPRFYGGASRNCHTRFPAPEVRTLEAPLFAAAPSRCFTVLTVYPTAPGAGRNRVVPAAHGRAPGWPKGAPAEAQRSGSGGERRSKGANMIFALRRKWS